MKRESYEELVDDPQRFRESLDSLIAHYPELFPAAIGQGDHLYGWERRSVKMPDIRIRRIGLNEPDEEGRLQVDRVMPSFLLPSRVGDTDEVEKALFWRRFGVPSWAWT